MLVDVSLCVPCRRKGARLNSTFLTATPRSSKLHTPNTHTKCTHINNTGTVRCDVEKDAFVAHYRALQASYDKRVASGEAGGGAAGGARPRWRPPDDGDGKRV